MSLPKKGTRTIIVDEKKYRWKSTGNDYGIDVLVERVQGKGQLFRFTYPYEYDENNSQIGVTPSIVEKFIYFGLKTGWEPDKTGTFLMNWLAVEKHIKE